MTKNSITPSDEKIPDGRNSDGDVNHSEVLFCGDPKCPDQEDQERIGTVAQWYSDGLVSSQDADNIYRGRTI